MNKAEFDPASSLFENLWWKRQASRAVAFCRRRESIG
jgi:hypothetical protein